MLYKKPLNNTIMSMPKLKINQEFKGQEFERKGEFYQNKCYKPRE